MRVVNKTLNTFIASLLPFLYIRYMLDILQSLHLIKNNIKVSPKNTKSC